jgi:hypothetical protein
VNIDGCHVRYRPTLVRFEGGYAVVRSLSGDRRWPASKVRPAAPIPVKRRARPDQEYD